MPPKTAMRSGIVRPSARVRADAAMLVAGVTRVMAQRVGSHRFAERSPQDRVRSLEQDRADVNAAVGDEAGMTAQQQAGVESGHHFTRDPLVGRVTAAALGLGAQ